MLKKYFYLGCFKDGRKIFGFIRAENIENAKKILKSKNIFIKKIFVFSLFSKKLKNKDVISFFMQSRLFLKNGYSFFRVLDVLEDREDFRTYIEKMRNGLKNGCSLYEVFKNNGLKLKNTYLMILKAGEESGNIERAFEIIENSMREKEVDRQNIIKIMIYPSMIFILVVVLIFFLGIFILPDFIKMIDKNRGELPFITRTIIFCTEKFKIIFLAFSFLFFLVINIFRNKNISEKIFQKLIKINIIKRIVLEIFISNFAEMLVILVSSGISVTDAVILIKNEIKNKYFKEKLCEVAENLKKGNSIYFSLKATKIFTKTDMELIRSGEETGELASVLKIISERNKNTIRQKTDLGIKILEPLSIIIIGTVIGAVFLGIYIPIFQAMDNI